MDANRVKDGLNLRNRFARETNHSYSDVSLYLCGTCSVLEVMTSLALRGGEDIMGDDPSIWFWKMIENLGLDSMTDTYYDEDYVNEIIQNMMNRRYRENGKGGLFIVKSPRYDMRKAELWYQMCWYIDELLDDNLL